MKKFLLIPFFIFCHHCHAQEDTIPHVGQMTFSFTDTSRHRLVTTELWYPTNSAYRDSDIKLSAEIPFVRVTTARNAAVIQRPQPLVIFSHGFGGTRLSSEWFAVSLAQKGFLVPAVDHWGNNYNNMKPDIAVRFLERPRDISFALTQLLKDTIIGKNIDTSRIGAAGFSMGGYTVIVLAGGEPDYPALLKYVNDPEGSKEFNWPELPTLRDFLNDQATIGYYKSTPSFLKDRRIKAVFALSPALGKSYTNTRQVRHIDIPVFIAGTAADSITPVKTNAAHYHQLIRNSIFFLIPGKAGHYVMLEEATEPLKKNFSTHFADDPSIKRISIHNQVAEMAVDFFEKNFNTTR